MFPIRVSEATIATAHRVMQPGGNQEAKTVVYLSCMIDNLSSRMSKTVSILGFIHHEQGFFPGPIVSLSSTTTVNNTDPRIDCDSVWQQREESDAWSKENSQKAWSQIKVGGSMWWSGLEWVAGFPLFSSQSKLFLLLLPLSYIKSLAMILLPRRLSILEMRWKGRNLKNLFLFSINHQLDKKIEPIHHLLFSSRRTLITWFCQVCYKGNGSGKLADLNKPSHGCIEVEQLEWAGGILPRRMPRENYKTSLWRSYS